MSITNLDTNVKIENIPDDLKHVAQFINWHEGKDEKGNPTKLPINALTKQTIDAHNISHHLCFDEAYKFAVDHGVGVGFVFTKADAFIGIDIDDCVESGVIQPWAWRLIVYLDTYCEISPSGTGVKLFAQGEFPFPGKKYDPVELYNDHRFFTITGNHVVGTPKEVKRLSQEQLRLVVFIAQLLKKPKGRLLFGGEWSTDDYPSQNEADLALCSIVGNLCDENTEVIDALMRISGLYRDKWEREDYRTNTISLATSGSANFKLTDLGNAERFADQYRGILRYCTTNNRWYLWNEQYWEVDELGYVYELAKKTIRAMYKEAATTKDDDYRQALAKHARQSESRNRIQAMLELARYQPGIAIPITLFNNQPYKLSVKNGTINFFTGKLERHTPLDYITTLVPITFDERATCPIFMSFLRKVLNNNQNLIDYIQKVIGYTLTGDVSEQSLFYLYGDGENGKTTL